MTARLAEHGWVHVAYGDQPGSATLKYGNLIASRHPLEPHSIDWTPAPPWPQSFVHATVHALGQPFDVVGVHIPNGSSNGWRKIETFESLAGTVQRLASARPLLIAGDFNEPRAVLDDGTVIPFGARLTNQGSWSTAGTKTGRCGRRFPRQRWVDGVRRLLGQHPVAGLRHVGRALHGPTFTEATHRVRNRDRFFDHILVSPDWRIDAAGFDHDVRTHKVSDHSLAWANLTHAT